jgi:hypothetical protein
MQQRQRIPDKWSNQTNMDGQMDGWMEKTQNGRIKNENEQNRQ